MAYALAAEFNEGPTRHTNPHIIVTSATGTVLYRWYRPQLWCAFSFPFSCGLSLAASALRQAEGRFSRHVSNTPIHRVVMELRLLGLHSDRVFFASPVGSPWVLTCNVVNVVNAGPWYDLFLARAALPGMILTVNSCLGKLSSQRILIVFLPVTPFLCFPTSMDGSGLDNYVGGNLCALNSTLQQTRHFPLLKSAAIMVADKRKQAQRAKRGNCTHRNAQVVSCARSGNRHGSPRACLKTCGACCHARAIMLSRSCSPQRTDNKCVSM